MWEPCEVRRAASLVTIASSSSASRPVQSVRAQVADHIAGHGPVGISVHSEQDTRPRAGHIDRDNERLSVLDATVLEQCDGHGWDLREEP